ncbi:MAG: phosphoglycerate kinase [Alphaproteobacteria bacterium]|nr:phosphoglycerate kinase [Alphaproteobacteria bacterium]
MSLNLRTLDDIDLQNKKVFLRVDFNIPINNGVVGDCTRIEASLPTIREIRQKGGRIALFSHLGRPNGCVNPKYSLKPLIKVLEQYFPNTSIIFKDGDYIQNPENFWKNTDENTIILAENIRFYEDEEKNDIGFAKKLAQLADIVVNDAFATCHRSHASIVAITQFLPSFAGRLLESELTSLYHFYIQGKQPFMAMIGGAKISSKIEVLKKIIPKIQILGIGGGMANTFLLAQGYSIGKSLAESGQISIAKDILQQCQKSNKKVILPIDVVVAEELSPNTKVTIKSIDELSENDCIFDIGPKTIALLKNALNESKTLLWNGPLGAFETKPFDQGTHQFAQYATLLTKEKKITSITGGGDSVAALTTLGLEKDFSYVSTGGGAFLEWIEGRIMPGLEVLFKNNPASCAILF